MRETFDGKVAILAAFSRTIDTSVLKGGVAGGRDDSPRDRLFDVMMRRFDALAPYKPAIRRVARSARRDPGLACMLHRISRRSAQWTLAAAGINRGGALGRIAAEGVVLAYLEAMRAWFDDDGTDLARTMAALDRALARGERAMQALDDATAFLCRLGGRLDGLRRGDHSGADA